MLKMKTIVHTNVNAREYEFSFQPDSPIDDILIANNQINAFVIGKQEQAKQAQQPQGQPEMPPSDLPVTDEVK